MSQFLLVVGIAATASLASIVSGYIASRRRPSSTFLSIALGFAAGVLIATITTQMVPRAQELSSPLLATAGFALGLVIIYGFELVVQRGRTAGPDAQQRERIQRFHREHPPRGDQVTVLAGGTTLEELIEGLSIGAGAAVQPGLAVLIAASIALDNLGEGLSIGSLARESREDEHAGRVRGMAWTSTIATSLFLSAVISWLVLRTMPDALLGFLVAIGAGGMLYLTITDLVPEAEMRHVQHSSALAAGAGFVVVLIASSVL